jgi:hypothetical protein
MSIEIFSTVPLWHHSGAAYFGKERLGQFPESKVKATKERAVLKSLATVEDVADQMRPIVMSKIMTGQKDVIDSGIAI